MSEHSAIGVYRALAPAKVNLGLFVGELRAADAKHELVSVMQSISLADELTLRPAAVGVEHDEVICQGVDGPAQDNLAARALRAFRAATGWQAGPLRLHIEKRIPVAAGLAGGSADAAATLRLARQASGLGDERLLLELGAELGADVPAQISPGRWLAAGAGERLNKLPAPVPFGVLVLPASVGLSTAAVFAESDRRGHARSEDGLRELGAQTAAALADGQALPSDAELLHNDLQDAAAALCPEIVSALEQAREAGARFVLLSGSGPTVVGLFDEDARGGVAAARRAAAHLRTRVPAPIFAESVDAAFARAYTLDV